jgi:hypothetical protein
MLAEATNSGGNGAAGMCKPRGGATLLLLLPVPVDWEKRALLPEETTLVAPDEEDGEDDEEEAEAVAEAAAADEEDDDEDAEGEEEDTKVSAADRSKGSSAGHSSRVNQIAGTHG